ncbi:MAG: hypothetical protein JJT94_02930 [Bernardetiaceae bacterium]|nr:hypothetical protein [Bernardetiaceae bacterium]
MTKKEFLLLQALDNLELDIFTTESLEKEYHLDLLDWQSSFDNLVKSGYLISIEKGKYCRHNFPNEYVISNYLAQDAVVAYGSALYLHGLTKQFPNAIFVQTSKQKKHQTVFDVHYQFVRLRPQKIIGVIKKGTGNHQYRMTDVEKTLIDCFDLPEYSSDFPELLRAFAAADLDAEKMIRYCRAVRNIAIVKKMAYLIEILNKKGLDSFLAYAKKLTNQKYTLFDDLGEKKGILIHKWKLQMNLDKKNILEIVKK